MIIEDCASRLEMSALGGYHGGYLTAFKVGIDRIAFGVQLTICFFSETQLTIDIPDDIGFGNNKGGYSLISWTTLTYEW